MTIHPGAGRDSGHSYNNDDRPQRLVVIMQCPSRFQMSQAASQAPRARRAILARAPEACAEDLRSSFALSGTSFRSRR